MPSSLNNARHDPAQDGVSFTPPARNPYVLVVGCPRSGTTLLQRMLDSHPQLAVANDTHFISRALEKTAPDLCEAVNAGDEVPLTAALIDGVSRYHRFSRLGLSEAMFDLAANNSRTYRDFISALYDQYSLLHRKPLSGEKTPDYVRFLPMLHALLPWVRTVHIIRDGRDVALSTLEWANENKGPGKLEYWKDEPVAVCALWWRWQVNTGRQDGARLGKTAYCEVLYEKLVTHAEQTLRQIAAFLDLSFAPEMLAYHDGKTRPMAGLSAKSAWLPPTAGLRDWRTQLPERDLALFEALAGPTLVNLGYERAIETIPPAIQEVAQSIEYWWQSAIVRRRGRPASVDCAKSHE